MKERVLVSKAERKAERWRQVYTAGESTAFAFR